MDPIVRWAGSKRQMIPHLKRYWRGTGRYIEPFCGSACLFFSLEPNHAVLGDLNIELMTAYRALKRDAGLVCECLKRLRASESEYYRIRSTDCSTLSEPEAAARFLYLNKYCFNGIYRTNRQGKFNVPYGPPKSTRRAQIDYDRIVSGASLLHRATLLGNDFEVTLDRVSRGDFVYLDPPYAVRRRRIFAEYHEDAFGVHDLERLGSWLLEINKRGAHFVVSYADSREARELLACWNPKRIRARRHIAGFVGHRRHAYELMASNLEER